MPTYEFECLNCCKKFSQTISVKEKEKGNVKCPHCGSNKLSQLITSFQVKTAKKS